MGKITGFLEYQRLQEASEDKESRKKHYRDIPIKIGCSAMKPEKPGIPMDTSPPMMKATATSGILAPKPPSEGMSRVCAWS